MMNQKRQQSSTPIVDVSSDGVIPENRLHQTSYGKFFKTLFFLIKFILIIAIFVCCFFLLIKFMRTNTNNIPIEEYPGFRNFPFNCGLPKSKPKIGNGNEAELSEFPWHVVLMRSVMVKTYFNRDQRVETPFCGGSLLSENLILTAAHCIEDLEHPESYIVLGEHDLFTDPDCVTSHFNKKCADPIQRFNSSELVSIIHPDYNNGTTVNDLALIKLKRPAKFSKSVAPICLPFHEKNLPQKITVAGYGATEKEFFPDVLIKMTVPVIEVEKCRTFYTGSYKKMLTMNHFCAIEYKKSRYGGKYAIDSCEGDSGSPAFFPSSDSKFIQYGIVSWGQKGDCGNFKKPGVYVSVYPYLEWILSNSFVE